MGIVDDERNPFSDNDWINQGYSLTKHRKKQLSKLFNKSIAEIKKIKRNEGPYPAFVGIRWGFAEIQSNRLIPTYKWDNQEHYDKFGNSIS